MTVYGVDVGSTAERIAGAARGILVAEGAGAVSMRRVAQAVGLTPMAIYRHYANRGVLLQRVADESFREIAERWGRSTRTGTAEERLFAALDDYLGFALSEPRLYDFVFGERRDDARIFPADFRAERSPTLNVVAEVLRDGIADGTFRDDDVWEVALLLAACLHGLVQLYHSGRIGLPEDGFRELCRSSARRMFDGINR